MSQKARVSTTSSVDPRKQGQPPEPEDIGECLYIGLEYGTEVSEANSYWEETLEHTIEDYFIISTNIFIFNFDLNGHHTVDGPCFYGLVNVGGVELNFIASYFGGITGVLPEKSGLVNDTESNNIDPNNIDNDDKDMTLSEEMCELADELEEKQREREEERVKEYLREQRDVFKAEITDVNIERNNLIVFTLNIPTHGEKDMRVSYVPDGEGSGERLYEILAYLGATPRDMDMIEGMYLPMRHYNAGEWCIHLPSDSSPSWITTWVSSVYERVSSIPREMVFGTFFYSWVDTINVRGFSFVWNYIRVRCRIGSLDNHSFHNGILE